MVVPRGYRRLGWLLALAGLCMVCLVGVLRRVPWGHEQRIYLARSVLLPGRPTRLEPDCPGTRLGMLGLFTEWLDRHSVPYFLVYGTLLGAVREGSIISFTPDLDIAVPALSTPRVQRLFEQELHPCFETGPDGVNGEVFHIYTRAPAVEQLHAASPLLPFLRAEPWLDVYGVLICAAGGDGGMPADGSAGVLPSRQSRKSVCTTIVESSRVWAVYLYIVGLSGAAANSKKADGRSCAASRTPAARMCMAA